MKNNGGFRIMERIPNCPLAVMIIETQCHVDRNRICYGFFKVQRISIDWKETSSDKSYILQ